MYIFSFTVIIYEKGDQQTDRKTRKDTVYMGNNFLLPPPHLLNQQRPLLPPPPTIYHWREVSITKICQKCLCAPRYEHIHQKDLIVFSDFRAKIHVLIGAHRMRSILHSLLASSPILFKCQEGSCKCVFKAGSRPVHFFWPFLKRYI